MTDVRTRLVLTAAVIASFAVLPLSRAEAPTTTPSYGTTWTVNSTANSMSEYAADASGTDAPVATIHGAATGLHSPSAVAISPTGKLFVANAGNDSITEYAADASGNAAPIATISGSKTGLDGPSSLVLAGGAIWVTDPDSNLVESFTQGETGNVLPAETLAGHRTKLDHPVALAADDTFFSSITVVNDPPTGKASIVSFFTTKRGDIKPQGQVMGTRKHKLVSPTAIMPFGFGWFWLADSGTNSVSLLFVLPGLPSLRARQVIAGSNTGLDDPTGLSHDALGRLVVSNAGDHTLRVFGVKAAGNATPLRTLTGVGAGAGDPAAAAVFGIPPGAPTNLKVTLHKTNASMSWKPPAVTGGGLAGYQVHVFREDGGGLGGGGGIRSIITLLGGNVLDVTTTKTSFTKHNIKPGHRYEFIVSAVNGFGMSRSIGVRKAHVLPPSAPRHVRVLAGAHSLLVAWRPPKHDGGARVHYRVQYAAGCTPGTKGCKTRHLVTGKYNNGSARIPSLKRHTKYQVRVIARNSKGAGHPSKVAKATTQ